jgi:hypothetical protein
LLENEDANGKGQQGQGGMAVRCYGRSRQPATTPKREPTNRPKSVLKVVKTAVPSLQLFVTFVTWKGHSSRVKLLPDTSSLFREI